MVGFFYNNELSQEKFLLTTNVLNRKSGTRSSQTENNLLVNYLKIPSLKHGMVGSILTGMKDNV